jgi:membrane protease YdiL (CAAX protease family)
MGQYFLCDRLNPAFFVRIAEKEVMGNKIKAMPLGLSFLYFGIPAIYFWCLTNYLTPYLNNTVGLNAALSWFVTGLLVFVPLFLAAWGFTKKEGHTESFRTLLARLRLKKFTTTDWAWAIGGLGAILILTGFIYGISIWLAHRFGLRALETTPSFMEFEPLKTHESWMLLVWLMMFFFNIVGEEIFWRGYIMPRQELANRKYAWLVNSVLWGVFHISFGWHLLVIVTPTLLILPYAVYKTKNTMVGIFIHGIFNGPMFLLVALGILM